MCVNPAALTGGAGVLDPYVPALVLAFLPSGSAPAVRTPWVSFPGEYTGRCETSGNATWLQVTHIGAATTSDKTRARLKDLARIMPVREL